LIVGRLNGNERYGLAGLRGLKPALSKHLPVPLQDVLATAQVEQIRLALGV